MIARLLQAVGAGLVAVGAFLWLVPVGFVVSGVFCLLFGVAGEIADARKG